MLSTDRSQDTDLLLTTSNRMQRFNSGSSFKDVNNKINIVKPEIQEVIINS